MSSPGQSTDAQPPQDAAPADQAPSDQTSPDSHPYDARKGSGDPRTDPAAVGEVSAGEPDGDGGAVPHDVTTPEPGTG